MNEDQLRLFEEAGDSIAAARLLLDGGFAGYAAARAYYAMFYVAEAMLEGDGLAFSKHSAVIAAFGEHYARTEVVPVRFHRYLIEAQALRHAGDYGERNAVDRAQAEAQIARAAEMLQSVQEIVKRLPSPPEACDWREEH